MGIIQIFLKGFTSEFANKIECSFGIHSNYCTQQTEEHECHFILFFGFGKYFSAFWPPYCTLSYETLIYYLWNVSSLFSFCLHFRLSIRKRNRSTFDKVVFFSRPIRDSCQCFDISVFLCTHCCYIKRPVFTLSLPVHLANKTDD